MSTECFLITDIYWLTALVWLRYANPFIKRELLLKTDRRQTTLRRNVTF